MICSTGAGDSAPPSDPCPDGEACKECFAVLNHRDYFQRTFMNFYQHLKSCRLALEMNPVDAAQKLRLSTAAYLDRENAMKNINVPEKVGMLVVLGMPLDEALVIAQKPSAFRPGELVALGEEASKNPFVKELKDHFAFVRRDHDSDEYTIEKSRVENANDILGWTDQLCEKNWVTTSHVQEFVRLAA